MKRVLGLSIVLVLVGLFLWNVISDTEQVEERETASNASGEERQMVATDFELETLTGETMKLSDTRGKITILNFWASWCEPCKMEAPHLQAFYEENQDKVEIVAVNITDQDSVEKAIAFAEEYGFTFPVLFDKTGDVSMMYGAFTIPTTIFLNEEGEIVQQFAGPMEEEFLEEVVDSI